MSEPQQPYGPPPGGSGQPWSGQPAYGPPAYLGQQPPAPHSGATETEAKAVVALVLAVLAYTPVVPFVGAIAALVLARYARRDIERSGGAKTGLGLVKAARVLAWVHLVFVAVLVVLAVLVLALPVGISFL